MNKIMPSRGRPLYKKSVINLFSLFDFLVRGLSIVCCVRIILSVVYYFLIMTHFPVQKNVRQVLTILDLFF
jgi:hypothetical protein